MFDENENVNKNEHNDFFRETVINSEESKTEQSAGSSEDGKEIKNENSEADGNTEPETVQQPELVSDSLIFSRDVECDNPYIKETLLNQKKKNKWKMFRRYTAAVLCGMFVGAAIFGGGMMFANRNSGGDSIIKQYSGGAATLTSGNENGELSVTQISAKVGPSVVGIVNKQSVTTWFGTSEQDGSGSGIIISDDGYILTNSHVVENATSLTVVLSNSKEYSATIVGQDSKTDLAVLKIDATGLPAAELGKSSELAVGDLAVAIGNPLGMEFYGSVTQGIISALNRTMNVEGREYTLIQTDAAINPGNSGGPLVNKYGQVIGINTVKISSSSAEGMGFAIPIDVATPIVNDLIKNGYVTGRPQIGVATRDITENMSQYYGMPMGVYVVSVVDGSGAAAAGIKTGDIITAVDGTEIKTAEELNSIKDKHKAGDTLSLTIVRSGQKTAVNVTLGEEKSQS